MRRILSLILLAAMLTLSVSAAPVISETGTTATWDGFTLEAVQGTSHATVENGVLSLGFTTEANEGNATAVQDFAFEGDILTMTATVSVSGTEGANQRKITLKERNSASMTCDLINVHGGTIYVFTKAADLGTVTEGTDYTVTVAVETASGYGAAYLDGELIYSGELGTKWKSFNYNNLRLELKNYTFPKNSTMTSDFKVSGLSLEKGGVLTGTNPADGDNLADATAAGITVTYDGVMHADMYTAGYYALTENGSAKTITVEKEGNNALLIPEGGFTAGANYVLTVPEVKALTGTVIETDKTVSFRTAPADYVRPVLTLETDKTEIYEGQTALISVAAEPDTVATLTFTVDGEDVKTVTGDDEYTYEFSAMAGSYEISAYSIDTEGGRSDADAVTVTVLANDAPTVSTAGIADGGAYEKKELKEVTFDVTDDGEIVSVTAYANGEELASLTEAPYTFDFSGIPFGANEITVAAEDNVGVTGEAVYTITVKAATIENVTTITFDDKNSGGVGATANDHQNADSPAAIEFIGGLGGKAETDLAYAMYVDTLEPGKLLDPYYSLAGTTVQPAVGSKITVEFEVYITEGTGQACILHRAPYYDAVSSRLLLSGSGGIQTNKQEVAEYTPGTWSKPLRFVIKRPADSVYAYEYWYDGVMIATAETSTWSTWFRFSMTTDNTAGAEAIANPMVAIDNYKIITYETEPIISDVGYDGIFDREYVKPYAKKIDILMTAPVTGVSKDTVKLYKGEEEVALSSVAFANNIISVVPAEKLETMAEYRVVLSGLYDNRGNLLTEDRTAKFTVDYNDIDLGDVVMSASGSVSGKLVNRTGASKTLFVAVTVWEGNKLVDINVTEKQVNGITSFTTGTVSKTAGQTVTISVWDSLSAPTVYLVSDL